ncbi:MAG TPA: nucleoside monophosphate kinase [Candidatus Binatus sp.]|nr:nucleoside monophosphate kinase [Candidatus Binatus sp.]
MLITISGLPGSGKTTVAQLVARTLGLEHVYAGDIFRKQAEAQGLTLEEYQRRAETDHSIDRALDDQMRSRAARGNAVLEGRLAAFMAEAAGQTALRVFLDAPEPIRAVRIAGREGGGTSERLREIQAREASDARRYRVIYGVDYHDPAHYDLVLHSDGRSPEELAAEIVEHARRLP